MLIWSRGGILAPIMAAFSLILTEYLVNISFSQNYYQDHGWPKFIALSIAGLLCLLLGHILNDEGKTYINKETGKEVILRKKHSFFFIDIDYWGIIFPIIGIISWIASN
ncbi:hypothetical protein I3900191A7_08240 [Clostridium baratii]|uniref:hypothetical protein n=1 Tax=Clostridium baratii TaxID=1561 RepID=UPI002A74D63E|nr:hypothetical protein [Clostridium baratii]MDY3206723.1 hypothetical protein [Clostridium baratii]